MKTDIRAFVRRAYPKIGVRLEPWADDPKRAAVYFTEAQFASLYPAQRYHYLRNLIPADGAAAYLGPEVRSAVRSFDRASSLLGPGVGR